MTPTPDPRRLLAAYRRSVAWNTRQAQLHPRSRAPKDALERQRERLSQLQAQVSAK